MNLVSFRHAVLQNGDGEVAPAEFHYKWSDMLLEGKGHICIEGFRQSAKTNYVMRAFPLFALAFPAKEREYIVFIKNNATGAETKLKEIIAEYESNPALLHNLVKIVEKSGKVFSVDVRDENGEVVNVRMEAYGKGSSIRGLMNRNRRPSIVICDDLQDTEDARSDLVQETDFNWFTSDILFLGKMTRIFMIANNLGAKCIAERIAENAEELGFYFERVPIEINGVPTWPAAFDMPFIEAEKEKFKAVGKLDNYLRERMCVALADENRIFHKEDFRYYCKDVLLKNAHDYNFFMTVDPAASTETTSDYRACMVVAVDEKNNWFCVDCSYGTYDSTKLVDEIFRLVVEWGLNMVHIEKGVLKSALEPFMLQEMSKRNVFFDIVPLDHGGRAKVERIRVLSPRFKAHTVWFPDSTEAWITELESELMAMTMQGSRGLRDDLCDALSYGNDCFTAPFKKGRQTSGLPREGVFN